MSAQSLLALHALLLLAFGAQLACGCPDLALPVVLVRVEGPSGQDDLRFDVERVGGPESARFSLHDVDLIGAALPVLPAGRYHWVVKQAGREIARFDDVCTMGALTGCAAQAAEQAGARPLELSIDRGQTPAHVRVRQRGRCSPP